MKFWQLVSIVRDDADLIARVASTNPAWKEYKSLVIEFPVLVRAQNRAVLDALVDTDFVIAVLGLMRRNLYLSSDNWLRSWQLETTDQIVSILDSFVRYGADVVEAVCESGAVKIR